MPPDNLPRPRVVTRPSTSALILVATVLALVAGCGTGTATGADDRDGVMIAEDAARPEFVLTDTAGRPFDFARETEGYLTLLYFGYTNCPDVCPIHFANIAGALEQVPSEVRERVKVVFVGVDPPRDSPENIRAWLDHFDRDFIGLTGTDDALGVAQLAAGVPPATREESDAEGRYAVNHAGWVYGYTPYDEETWQFPLGVRQEAWASIIERLVEEYAS